MGGSDPITGCDSKIKKKKKNPRLPGFIEIQKKKQLSHSPSETLTHWRVEKKEGQLPPRIGDGRVCQVLFLMRGAPCYPGLMLFISNPGAVVLGKQAEDGGW